MAILIEGMEMPKTGLYFVGVDNSNGRDKTVITVERMLGNRDVRQIVGSFELITVPEPHGRLIDADKLHIKSYWYNAPDGGKTHFNYVPLSAVKYAPTIIPASEEG